MAAELLIAQGKQRCRLLLRMANRPGLVAGATGTGKTVTLRVIARPGALGKSATHAVGSQVGREIIRGVLGSIFGSATTRRRR
jgi:hypothetical protein